MIYSEQDQVIDDRKVEIIKAAGDIRQLLFSDLVEIDYSQLATNASDEVAELHSEVTDLYDEYDVRSDQGVYLLNKSQNFFHVRLYPFVITSFSRTPPTFRKKPFGTWRQAESLEHHDGQQPILKRVLEPIHTLRRNQEIVGSTQATVEKVSEVTKLIWLNRMALNKHCKKPLISAAVPNTVNFR